MRNIKTEVYKCDFCGNECGKDEFILPVWQDARGGHGNVVLAQKVNICIKKANLCVRCANAVADTLYEIYNSSDRKLV